MKSSRRQNGQSVTLMRDANELGVVRRAAFEEPEESSTVDMPCGRSRLLAPRVNSQPAAFNALLFAVGGSAASVIS